jgi:hypothetical protein
MSAAASEVCLCLEARIFVIHAPTVTLLVENVRNRD